MGLLQLNLCLIFLGCFALRNIPRTICSFNKKKEEDNQDSGQKMVRSVNEIKTKDAWYKDGKQIMITPTHDTKDIFNEKQLRNLNGEMKLFAAKDNPSKRTPILPNFKNLNEKKQRVSSLCSR